MVRIPGWQRTPFVGREPELAALNRGREAASQGRGGIVLLAGEPGIGKTRTAEELALVAERDGGLVLWGRCYEGEGAPAFWPWIQILRDYFAGRDDVELRAMLGAVAADVAQLVPELRDRLPDLPLPPTLESTAARFRLFEGIAGVLRRAATHRPLLLILDDLHWADAPSLLLLEFVAAQLSASRILILGLYRDVEVVHGHRLGRTMGDVLRRPGAERIILERLSPAEVARLVEATGGADPAVLLARTVLQHAEGNPLFVGETLRLLQLEGEPPPPAGPDSSRPAPIVIPPTVRETIGRRLSHLSETCQQILSVAAVIGREFGLSILCRAVGDQREAILDALDEAEATRIIAPVPDAPGRYRFTHVMIRETLYDALATNQRARLHRQVGEALEVTRPHAPPAELAHHFVKAAGLGEAERAIGYARQAGDRAVAALAYEEGIRLYRLALDTLESWASTEIGLRCELLLALGGAEQQAGEDEAARESFFAAAEVARAIGSAEHLARAALNFGGARLELGGMDRRWRLLLEEAAGALENSDSALRAQVLARLATTRRLLDAPERTEAISREAVEVARRAGERSALADAIDHYRLNMTGAVSLEERLALSGEMHHLGHELDNRELLARSQHWRVRDLLELGDLAAVDAAIEEYERLVEELRHPYYRWRLAMVQASRALLHGRLEATERALERARALMPAEQREGMGWFMAGELHPVRFEQGRFAEVEPVLRQLIERQPMIRTHRYALAWVLSELGREDDARRELDALAANGALANLRSERWWNLSVIYLADLCANLGDTARAAEVYEVLLNVEDTIVSRLTAVCYGSTSYYLGRVANAMGKSDEAERHFGYALTVHAQMPSPLLLAHTQRQYAAMLLGRGAPGDRERACELAGQALNTAERLGLPYLVERARTLLGQLGAPSSEPQEGPALRASSSESGVRPAGLTEREVQVLRMVAAGATNDEIAEALVVSRSTIRMHTIHIYQKIGARGRADAVAYALRHGLAGVL